MVQQREEACISKSMTDECFKQALWATKGYL